MESDVHDEIEIFAAIDASGARSLLIGRRALVVYGLPLLTADYDLWLAFDDIELLNRALSSLDMLPNRTAEDARRAGRYVIENGDRVDVLVARSCPTVDGVEVRFDDVWKRRERRAFGSTAVHLPCLDDLISTKRFADRDRDRADVAMLEALRKERAR